MIPSEIRRGISAGCDFKCIRITCQIGSFSASIVRLRGIKGRRRKPLYHLFHRIFPDLRRIRAAVQAGKCLLLVVANPDRHRIIWRHAAEPGVKPINQESELELVVPVFPAASILPLHPIDAAVPFVTTPFKISVIITALLSW